MSSVTLNLSRKWRSQDFDQIVGQELAVRILKNSLYLGHYFPVYLFAGQRGCGKTSTARIFAAAVNCHALPIFQKDPKKSTVPCLVCDSCVAMRDGNHPDFIEIDAASHTGVDNIRGIIESSSLLPLMGRKRVYLIDEAHMLSKAAFNAALKILEEPPATALFILATTNPHKIIDTVRSRCFQLFFTAVAYSPLKNHLQTICKKEKIAYTDDALDIIIRHTEGSVRDALNLLEQVRFSNAIVNKQAVLVLLGHIDDQHLMDIIQLTLQGSSLELVQLLHTLALDKHKAEFVWQRIVIIVRALLWIKYGVRPHDLVLTVKTLEEYARNYSVDDLHRMIAAFYVQEEIFFKTSAQHIFLEMVLLELCSKNKKKNDNDGGSAPCALGIAPSAQESIDEEEDAQEDNDEAKAVDGQSLSYEQQWQRFVLKTESLNDPLLHSLFKQGHFLDYVSDTHQILVELSKDFILFQDRFEVGKHLWQPILKEIFSIQASLKMQFTGTHKFEINKQHKIDTAQEKPVTLPQLQPRVQEPFRNATRYNNNQKPAVVFNKGELRVDVSDESKWKMAAMLQRHFPGVVTEIREKQ